MTKPAPELPRLWPASPRNRRLAGALAILAALATGPGCGREFFREWADQDVSEAVFEKSRDPRWRLDTFSIEPPALSRFPSPYDPDRPPAPPDDYATEKLSPVPQWPHHRLITPSEGTGYLDMLNAWRDQGPKTPLVRTGSGLSPAGAAAAASATPPGTLPPLPGTANPPPEPPEGDAGPFRPDPAANHGPNDAVPTPIPGTDPAKPAVPPQVKAPRKDPAVRVASTQAADMPAQAPTPTGPTAPRSNPTGLDPLPLNRDLNRPIDVRPDQSPREFQEAEASTSELSSVLVPGALTFDEAEAAGLSKDSRPYILNPAQAITLALINNRPYQFQLENIYLASLAVTLQRFAFQPQVYAGMSPLTAVAGTGVPNPNYGNSFLYRTKEAPGGQASNLNLGAVAGFGKLFMTGARVLGGFANQVVFNFAGKNARQPTVQSALPLSIALPLLRGGGRAVTLELLTQAERNLLYNIRQFARFRQEFIPYVLLASQPVDNPGTADPTIGYLTVLQQVQAVEIDRRNVAKFERVLEVFAELARGAGSDITQLQVDQVDQSLQGARQQLATDINQYRNLLDQYKIQLGLPPDTPLVLDRGLTARFQHVFNQIDRWSARPIRPLEELPVYLRQLPKLEDVVLDGRSLLKILGADNLENVEQLNEYLLAAERVALENRLDLMNTRAQLYDSWRQLAVTANALQGYFNVSISNQFLTPTNTTNPFGFIDQSKQFSLVLNTELPLVRVAERNNYMSAQIAYKRQQRLLMLTEDSIKNIVRQEIRNILLRAQTYDIQQRTFVITLRVVDQSQEQIVAPPAAAGGAGGQIAAQTINLINAQQRIPQTQNTLVQTWVGYQTFRLSLYRDLGIMPYDEWEAYHELFPSESAPPEGDSPVADTRGDARPVAARAARPAQVAGG